MTEVVRAALKQEFALSAIRPKDLVERNNEAAGKKRQELEKDFDKIQKELENGKRQGSEFYLKYRSGEISKDAFLKCKEEKDRQIQVLKARQEEINRSLRELDVETARQNHFLRTLLKFNEKSELNREVLAALVEKICIFPDKRIEITYRFHGKDFLRTVRGGEGHE